MPRKKGSRLARQRTRGKANRKEERQKVVLAQQARRERLQGKSVASIGPVLLHLALFLSSNKEVTALMVSCKQYYAKLLPRKEFYISRFLRLGEEAEAELERQQSIQQIKDEAEPRIRYQCFDCNKTMFPSLAKEVIRFSEMDIRPFLEWLSARSSCDRPGCIRNHCKECKKPGVEQPCNHQRHTACHITKCNRNVFVPAFWRKNNAIGCTKRGHE